MGALLEAFRAPFKECKSGVLFVLWSWIRITGEFLYYLRTLVRHKLSTWGSPSPKWDFFNGRTSFSELYTRTPLTFNVFFMVSCTSSSESCRYCVQTAPENGALNHHLSILQSINKLAEENCLWQKQENFIKRTENTKWRTLGASFPGVPGKWPEITNIYS